MTLRPVHVVGGGLAGSEAAWQIASAGVPVVLHEMRPVRGTEAHQTDALAELVCSNSFRSDDATSNAVGVIHAEMRLAGSLQRGAPINPQGLTGTLSMDPQGRIRRSLEWVRIKNGLPVPLESAPPAAAQ